MCGICGAFQLEGPRRRALEPATLERMNAAMVHRGPDDSGVYLADGVALGARRLSVVDVEGGHQPFANEDRSVWAVQNGELYNHAAIRERLWRDGHTLVSRCDTEILPHLYEQRGTAFPRDLRGMFGIAVWDGRRGRGVLARDRLGIKPLYYAEIDGLLLFASELKALLASGLVVPRLDHAAIVSYLTFGFTPAPLTPLQGVRKLMPGELLTVEDGEVVLERFWRYPEPVADTSLSLEDAAERLLELLDESVRMRLMSDVPLGAMLSGGLDSSLISALMARAMPEPVKTFSVGFRESGGDNELADAREVASCLGADHHELELSYSEQEVDLAELAWYLDEPLADLSSLGFLALSQLAKQHVTVALSGQGADELFGGYAKHRAAVMAAQWRRLPGPLRATGQLLAAHGPARARRASRTFAATNSVDRLLGMSSRLEPGVVDSLLRPEVAADGRTAARAAVESRLGDVPDDPLPATLFIDGQLALVDDMLHYFDRASMAHSLEVRVPFLDHVLVEYAVTIPAAHKIHRLQTKTVLKLAARGLVPDRIVDKRKIGFFNSAVGGWFNAQAEGVIGDFLLAPSPAVGELLDTAQLRRLVRQHVDGSAHVNPHLLLSILMLEVWLSTYLPRATAAPPPLREPARIAT
jgi:asparagine synthase (glutamine-hydrolysing)